MKQCICCKKEMKLSKQGNQKYCSACALFTKELRQRLWQIKWRLKELRKRYYGSVNTNWAVRNKNLTNGIHKKNKR